MNNARGNWSRGAPLGNPLVGFGFHLPESSVHLRGHRHGAPSGNRTHAGRIPSGCSTFELWRQTDATVISGAPALTACRFERLGRPVPPWNRERWRCRESNPRTLLAGQGRSPLHIPVVEPTGVEPVLPRCHRDVLPLDDGPIRGIDGSRTRISTLRTSRPPIGRRPRWRRLFSDVAPTLTCSVASLPLAVTRAPPTRGGLPYATVPACGGSFAIAPGGQ